MCTRCAFIAGVAAFAGAPVLASARTGDPAALELAIPHMKRYTDTVWLAQLTPNVWLHTTTYDISSTFDGIRKGDWYPANGAIVVRGDHAVLIDSGWTHEQTVAILSAWEQTRQPAIRTALVTHWHHDRLIGVPELAARGIPSYGNPLTIGLAVDNGYAPPKPLHDLEKEPVIHDGLEVFYPGEGHTLDNITVWIESDKVLFGGCLVKATTAPDLGFMGDGNLASYPATIRNLIQRYPRAKVVIPGHGTISGDSLAHTLRMAMHA